MPRNITVDYSSYLNFSFLTYNLQSQKFQTATRQFSGGTFGNCSGLPICKCRNFYHRAIATLNKHRLQKRSSNFFTNNTVSTKHACNSGVLSPLPSDVFCAPAYVMKCPDILRDKQQTRFVDVSISQHISLQATVLLKEERQNKNR